MTTKHDAIKLFEVPPIPLVSATSTVEFPVDALPTLFADMVAAVAESTQTDPAMAAVTVLTVLAAAAGGRADVEVRPGWQEPLCLYTATVANSGERKSAVQAVLTAPLLAVEQEMVALSAPMRTELAAKKSIAHKAVEITEKLAATATTTKDKNKHLAEVVSAREADAVVVPPAPRLLADDITPEAAASALAEQGGRLAIISAEGGIFGIIAGRYQGNVPSLDLWLKGHSGDPIKVDRKGRDPEYVPKPALTLGLMLQPSVLTTIGQQDSFRGRGLLARFLFAQPVSKLGRRKAGADPVPEPVKSRYDGAVHSLVKGLAELAVPAIITLAPATTVAVIALEEVIEPTLAGDGELAQLADWGSKYLGAVMRIAALLHLAQLGHKDGVSTPISVATLAAATRMGDYFKSCAIDAFSTMQMDVGTADAIYLLAQVAKVNGIEVSKRDLYNLARSRFKTVAEMMQPLRRLIDHGYLIPVEEPEPTPEPKRPGRKPSERFTIHPSANGVST
jgi:replicative DNA helicase